MSDSSVVASRYGRHGGDENGINTVPLEALGMERTGGLILTSHALIDDICTQEALARSSGCKHMQILNFHC